MTGILAAGAVSAGVVQGSLHIVKYLVPGSRVRARETFLAFVDEIPEDGTLEVALPSGRRVQLKRDAGRYAGFSDVCPHLGCRVLWQAPDPQQADPRRRAGFFRCPCHEGLFGPDGRAFAGPPAAAGQALTRVDLVRRGRALYLHWQEALS